MTNNQNNKDGQWKFLVLLLKEIAEQKNLSAYKIAQLTGIHRSTIGRIFELEFQPKLGMFLDIAKAVGVNFFFEGPGNKEELTIK